MSGGGSAQGGDADLKPARKRKTRRIIKSVLHNFLGTYTSRYSEFRCYWLFGFLVEHLGRITIDLLAEVGKQGRTPLERARWLAAQKFAEQIGKAGLPRTWFREARLEITKQARIVNLYSRKGYDVRFSASVITDLGKTIEEATSVFVAPHNPFLESQSARVVDIQGLLSSMMEKMLVMLFGGRRG